MSSIDRTPPYMQVVHHYKSKILDGSLSDGDPIPSARELSKEWTISQATAHKVIATLRADDLVETVVGVGTRVRSADLHRGAQDRFVRMLSTGRIYAPDEYAVISVSELAAAPPHIAAALGIEAGATAIRRQRVTHNETGPISASTSWFAADLAESVPALLSTERIRGGTPSAIREATGRQAHSVEDTTWADEASDDQAQQLNVDPGTPVMVGRNVLRDQHGNAIEAGEHVTGPRRAQRYEYELGSRD